MVQVAPSSVEGRRGLSKALEKAGRVREPVSRTSWNVTLFLRSGLSNPWVMVVLQLEDAMTHSNAACELRPKDPELLVLLGSQELKAKNTTDAMYHFQVTARWHFCAS